MLSWVLLKDPESGLFSIPVTSTETPPAPSKEGVMNVFPPSKLGLGIVSTDGFLKFNMPSLLESPYG